MIRDEQRRVDGDTAADESNRESGSSQKWPMPAVVVVTLAVVVAVAAAAATAFFVFRPQDSGQPAAAGDGDESAEVAQTAAESTLKDPDVEPGHVSSDPQCSLERAQRVNSDVDTVLYCNLDWMHVVDSDTGVNDIYTSYGDEWVRYYAPATSTDGQACYEDVVVEDTSMPGELRESLVTCESARDADTHDNGHYLEFAKGEGGNTIWADHPRCDGSYVLISKTMRVGRSKPPEIERQSLDSALLGGIQRFVQPGACASLPIISQGDDAYTQIVNFGEDREAMCREKENVPEGLGRTLNDEGDTSDPR
ncbi:hypothetical protein [Corynebacterium otitidis]|uniref:hypothetical protein n=1 Tax=Corynebacterium otitidis TaxID=29321 RepID=UPI0006280C62|nr:hypothetical protein [Corynebacterium otitidis]KKO83554.1 hypothetical protein AAV33_05800 [Corynebacterium otitidis]